MKAIKLITINILVFVFLILIVEVGFKINAHLIGYQINWSERNSIRQAKEVEKEAPPMSREEIEVFYGNMIVPSSVSAKNQYDWSLKGQEGQQRENFYPPGYQDEYYSRDFKNKKFNSYKTAVVKGEKKIIISLDYTFDENGLRRVISEHRFTKDNPKILAFGDSLTFGEGVIDGQDYPSQLEKKLKGEWKVHNFGFHGYGINDLYYQLVTHPEFFRFLKGSEGIAMWYFIPSHFERAFCHLNCRRRSPYIWNKPHYRWKEGQIVSDGVFDDSRGFDRKVIDFLSLSSTLEFFNIDYPGQYSLKEVIFFADLVLAVQEKIKEHFGLKEFYFIVKDWFHEKDILLNNLREKGIHVLDYSRIDFRMFSKYTDIPLDLHPTSEQHWLFTELLLKDLPKPQSKPHSKPHGEEHN